MEPVRSHGSPAFFLVSFFFLSLFLSPTPPRFRKRSCRDLLSFSHKGIREVWRWCWVIRPGRQWALDQGSSRPFKFFGTGIRKAIHSPAYPPPPPHHHSSSFAYWQMKTAKVRPWTSAAKSARILVSEILNSTFKGGSIKIWGWAREGEAQPSK